MVCPECDYSFLAVGVKVIETNQYVIELTDKLSIGWTFKNVIDDTEENILIKCDNCGETLYNGKLDSTHINRNLLMLREKSK